VRNRLKGTQAIALPVGRIIDRFKMAKHFELGITDSSFTWLRKAEQIKEEAALDGLYVVRTSVPAADLSAEATVSASRAWRSWSGPSVRSRPSICRCDPCPLERRARARARLSVHARLPRRVAHAREVKADVV
jgi:hypothetical protein